MHGHYANQAAGMAETHFRLVIEEHGTPEQKREINGWLDEDGKRHGGKRADDLRWMLMEELAEGAHFGVEGDPRVCNLRRGTPTPVARDEEECSDEGSAGPVYTTKVVEMKQGDEHVWRVAATRGMCAIKGCKRFEGTTLRLSVQHSA